MATAFEEALAAASTGGDITDPSIPSYMRASDTLNIANGNKTFIESALDVAESIPKFIGVSIISGANQLYNIPADIGNLLFDAGIERSNTEEVITSLDSDLGSFYKEHKEGSDLVGFMVSSLVPGIGAVKVLNAGQKSLRATIASGAFGENTGRALGLLAPSASTSLRQALKQARTSSSPVGLLNKDALRAMGAGLGQASLESLAFETAVAATLFQSPILENQDLGDFATNVAFGAGLFGIVGGTIGAAKISSALKRVGDTAAVEARPWTFIDEAALASTSYEKTILDFEQLHNIPPIPANVSTDRGQFLKTSAASKRVKLEGRIRAEMGVLSGGDQDVAETMFNTFKGAAFEEQQHAFMGLRSSSKMGIVTDFEKLQTKVAKGKATAKEIEDFAGSPTALSYARMWGEDAGVVMTDSPTITNLVDTLKKGQSIKVSKSGVTAGAKKFKFSTGFNLGAKAGTAKAGVAWNPLKADVLETNARYIWAQNLAKFVPTEKSPLFVHVDDMPLMEKVMLEVSDEGLKHVRFAGLEGGEQIGINLQEFIGARKVQLANRLLTVKGEKGGLFKETTEPFIQDEIAAMVNVKSSFLSGEIISDPVNTYHIKDILAMQAHSEVYTSKLISQGVRAENIPPIWAVPQHVKLEYDTSVFAGIDNHVIENMVIIKEQQKVYQEGTSRAAAAVLGREYDNLEDITRNKVFSGAVPSGAGAGFASAASSNYGTLAASVEGIGAITSRMITAAKDGTREVFEPLLYKLGNNQEASIEWSTLNANIRSIEGQYALNEAGDALEPLQLVRWRQATLEAQQAGTALPERPNIPATMEASVPLATTEVRELVSAHIEVNGRRTAGLAGLRTAQGMQFNRAAEAFYPIPVDPRDFPHFAIVVDESVTSGNHSKTLFASTSDELDGMISKLKQNPQLTILTKNEAEQYYKDRGLFEYEKTLSANYLDTEAHRKGVSAPFIVPTDPKKITTDMLNWHLDRETGLVREAVAAKYEVPFNELRRLGEGFTNVATSKFSNQNLLKFADDAVKNPFADYIKTALGIRKNADYPFWVNINQTTDAAVSSVIKKASAVLHTAKTPEQLDTINDLLTKAGYKGAHYDADMDLFANTGPARGTLTKVIQRANSIMATVVLRWDTLNAVNNAVSANVLLGAETKAVMSAISRGDEAAAGALAQLTRVKVPGIDETILSPTKLIANSIKKFNREGEDFKFYKENGYITSISDQYKSTLDDLTFNGKESVDTWGARVNSIPKKMQDLADKGERWTGNRLAEEFNRFVAADVMKQMTDVAVSNGLMSGKEQLAYINTFVNRTQGNYLAAQRPMMFQGPIGQAIGLFQTYQFNLMQQLLRHVGEGQGRDAMTLLALQGTIHGMNGLPAFNAINTHLIGTASGNTEHKDAYDAVYGAAGKTGGDWLMYGAASNALGLLHPDLKMNLYTRGDINPRHLTIVPTNPASVPIVQASGKFLANLFGTAKQLAAGGDISTVLLQGLEHNSISRPLAGIAQTLQGLNNPEQSSYSTSKRGNVIAANDFLSLANLGRVLGGKPLDEAIALDATYRYKSYGLLDMKKRQVLGQAIKTTMIAGQDPSQDQVEDFAEQYAKLGGRQEEFNKWFTQLYKTANLSQANKIQQSLKSPFTQSMQRIMGGRELRDFTNP